jgi:hypothetical protein
MSTISLLRSFLQCEQFLVTVRKIPMAKEKLQCLLLKLERSSRVESLKYGSTVSCLSCLDAELTCLWFRLQTNGASCDPRAESALLEHQVHQGDQASPRLRKPRQRGIRRQFQSAVLSGGAGQPDEHEGVRRKQHRARRVLGCPSGTPHDTRNTAEADQHFCGCLRRWRNAESS